MKIVIRAYSVFRDCVGDERVIDLKPGSTVRDLLAELYNICHIPSDIKPIVILNNQVVGEDHVLVDNSVVYITPQFSGGGTGLEYGGDVIVKLLRDKERLDFNEIVSSLSSKNPEVGALLMFVGFVKGVVDGKEVFELEYTAIEDMALKTLEKIARESAQKYGLKSVLILHRVGKVRRGDVTLVIAAVSTTRKNATRAVEEMLERVKHEVPIFKLERRSDGEYWVVGDGRRIPRFSRTQ